MLSYRQNFFFFILLQFVAAAVSLPLFALLGLALAPSSSLEVSMFWFLVGSASGTLLAWYFVGYVYRKYVPAKCHFCGEKSYLNNGYPSYVYSCSSCKWTHDTKATNGWEGE